jgi:hypothetical protein
MGWPIRMPFFVLIRIIVVVVIVSPMAMMVSMMTALVAFTSKVFKKVFKKVHLVFLLSFFLNTWFQKDHYLCFRSKLGGLFSTALRSRCVKVITSRSADLDVNGTSPLASQRDKRQDLLRSNQMRRTTDER